MLTPRRLLERRLLTVVGNISSGNPIQHPGRRPPPGRHPGAPDQLQRRRGNLNLDPAVASMLPGVAAAMSGASAAMPALTPDSAASFPGSHPGPLVFNCTPGSDGLAVFDVTGSQVFSNNLVQQIEPNLNGASPE